MARKKKPQVEDTASESVEEVTTSKGRVGLRNLKKEHFWGSRKRQVMTVVGMLVLIFVVIAAVPQLRYGVAGNFIKRDVTVMVTDAVTKKPVSEATVSIGGQSAKTDAEGKAVISAVPAGEYTAKIEKSHYTTGEASYTVPLWGDVQKLETTLTATGRQVPVSVVNKISKVALAGVKLTIGDTSAITDDKGLATIVLPVGEEKLKGTLELKDYNKTEVEVAVTEDAESNKLAITPEGRVFFLSKQSGKIDVVSTNLDGNDRETLVKGTGNESNGATQLIAARDWRYMALYTDREERGKYGLYIIDSRTGELKKVEGNQNNIIGWSGHKLLYLVNSISKIYEAYKTLKVYDAVSGKYTVIDQTAGYITGAYNYIDRKVYIIEDRIVYIEKTVHRYGDYIYDTKLKSVSLDGLDKKLYEDFKHYRNGYIGFYLHQPNVLQITAVSYNQKNETRYYEYKQGNFRKLTNPVYDTSVPHPIYLLSPSGKQALWQESRDGKNTLFVKELVKNNKNKLAELSEYTAYGWYTDEYILVSKDSSELYIASSNKSFKEAEPIKISNYHKPDYHNGW